MLFKTQSLRKKKNISNTALKLESELKSSIEPDNYFTPVLEFGLVLIKSDDPLSILFTTITKQEYSIIGTYKKYETDTEINLVYIFDGNKPSWGLKYLSELEDLECIKEIIIYETEKIHDLFDVSNSRYGSIREKILIMFDNLYKLPTLQKIQKNINFNSLEDLLSTCQNENSKKYTIKPQGHVSINFIKEKKYIEKIISILTDIIIEDKNFLLKLNNGIPINHGIPLDLIRDNISFEDLLLIIEEKNKEEKKIKIERIDKSPSLNIKNCVVDLKIQISDIVKAIKEGEIPCLELNRIIQNINNMSNYYDIGEPLEHIHNSSSGLISISSNEYSTPLILKTGNIIYLTTRNFNLSLFTRDELIEILERIDEMVIDNRFDYLRNKIISEISERN
jgi:hypothetical protein